MGIVAERVVLEQAVVTAPPKHVRVVATVQLGIMPPPPFVIADFMQNCR